MAFLSKMGNILKQTANVSQQISAQSSAARPSIFQAIRCMSTSKIFIGGLSYSTDDQGLHESFSKYGEVIEAKVIMDRETQRSRGFGFVTYTTSEDAASAIEALNDQDLHGRRVKVNYANERPPRTFGGNYGGGNGGYGGGGYGGNTGGGGGGWDQGTGGNYGGNTGGGGWDQGTGGNYGGNTAAGGGGWGQGTGGNYGGNTGGGWDQGTGGNFGGGGSNVGYGDNNNAGGNAFGGASDNYANNGGNFGADNFGSSNTGFGATDDNFAGGNNSSGLDGKQDSAAV